MLHISQNSVHKQFQQLNPAIFSIQKLPVELIDLTLQSLTYQENLQLLYNHIKSLINENKFVVKLQQYGHIDFSKINDFKTMVFTNSKIMKYCEKLRELSGKYK